MSSCMCKMRRMPSRLMPSSCESRWIAGAGRCRGPSSAGPLGRTPRRDQAHSVVGPQRLRMHPSELGGHRDDEDRCVVIDSLR